MPAAPVLRRKAPIIPAGSPSGAAIVRSNEFHQLSGLPTTPVPGVPVDEPPAGAVPGVGVLGLLGLRGRPARG